MLSCSFDIQHTCTYVAPRMIRVSIDINFGLTAKLWHPLQPRKLGLPLQNETFCSDKIPIFINFSVCMNLIHSNDMSMVSIKENGLKFSHTFVCNDVYKKAFPLSEFLDLPLLMYSGTSHATVLM